MRFRRYQPTDRCMRSSSSSGAWPDVTPWVRAGLTRCRRCLAAGVRRTLNPPRCFQKIPPTPDHAHPASDSLDYFFHVAPVSLGRVAAPSGSAHPVRSATAESRTCRSTSRCDVVPKWGNARSFICSRSRPQHSNRTRAGCCGRRSNSGRNRGCRTAHRFDSAQ